MNVLNELRQMATATRVDAMRLLDSTARSEALARADRLDDMRKAVAEHHDATAGAIRYRDDLHYQGLQDAFARVNGSQS